MVTTTIVELWTVTSWAEEALDESIGGRGSYVPLPRWWKGVHMEAMAVEGTAYES